MIAFLLILNFCISVFNAIVTGRSWTETKAIGGMARFMSWMGAVMATVGFTWCYLVIAALIAGPDGFNRLPPKYIVAMLSLGYLTLIVPLIGSGIAITVESWVYFWRQRSLAGGAIAGWNTFADLYNIYEAAEAIPSAWSSVSDVFFSKDSDSSEDDSAFARLALILVVFTLLAGVLTTAAIISTVSRTTTANRKLKYASR